VGAFALNTFVINPTVPTNAANFGNISEPDEGSGTAETNLDDVINTAETADIVQEVSTVPEPADLQWFYDLVPYNRDWVCTTQDRFWSGIGVANSWQSAMVAEEAETTHPTPSRDLRGEHLSLRTFFGITPEEFSEMSLAGVCYNSTGEEVSFNRVTLNSRDNVTIPSSELFPEIWP
jgi:hypothetical protein